VPLARSPGSTVQSSRHSIVRQPPDLPRSLAAMRDLYRCGCRNRSAAAQGIPLRAEATCAWMDWAREANSHRPRSAVLMGRKNSGSASPFLEYFSTKAVSAGRDKNIGFKPEQTRGRRDWLAKISSPVTGEPPASARFRTGRGEIFFLKPEGERASHENTSGVGSLTYRFNVISVPSRVSSTAVAARYRTRQWQIRKQSTASKRLDRILPTREWRMFLACPRSKLEIDERGFRTGLEIHQCCHRTVQIWLRATPRRSFEQRTGNKMLDDDRQRIEQRQTVKTASAGSGSYLP